MTMQQKISGALEKRFPNARIIVTDESEAHRGHAGYRDGGESHFHVQLSTEAFAGLSRLARHRAVHDALGPEILTKIHALSLDLGTET